MSDREPKVVFEHDGRKLFSDGSEDRVDMYGKRWAAVAPPFLVSAYIATRDAETRKARLDGMREAAKVMCHKCATGVPLNRLRSADDCAYSVHVRWMHDGNMPRCDAAEIHAAIARIEGEQVTEGREG